MLPNPLFRFLGFKAMSNVQHVLQLLLIILLPDFVSVGNRATEFILSLFLYFPITLSDSPVDTADCSVSFVLLRR